MFSSISRLPHSKKYCSLVDDLRGQLIGEHEEKNSYRGRKGDDLRLSCANRMLFRQGLIERPREAWTLLAVPLGPLHRVDIMNLALKLLDTAVDQVLEFLEVPPPLVHAWSQQRWSEVAMAAASFVPHILLVRTPIFNIQMPLYPN